MVRLGCMKCIFVFFLGGGIFIQGEKVKRVAKFKLDFSQTTTQDDETKRTTKIKQTSINTDLYSSIL